MSSGRGRPRSSSLYRCSSFRAASSICRISSVHCRRLVFIGRTVTSCACVEHVREAVATDDLGQQVVHTRSRRCGQVISERRQCLRTSSCAGVSKAKVMFGCWYHCTSMCTNTARACRLPRQLDSALSQARGLTAIRCPELQYLRHLCGIGSCVTGASNQSVHVLHYWFCKLL